MSVLRFIGAGAAAVGKGAVKVGWNATKAIGRGTFEQIKALPSGVTSSGTKDVLGSIGHYLRGADRTFFNKTEHSLNNIFGRKPKPWLMGALAFAALGIGTKTGENLYDNTLAEPQDLGPAPMVEGKIRPDYVLNPVSGQINALSSDASYNIPEDYGTTGLVQALHKNRHG